MTKSDGASKYIAPNQGKVLKFFHAQRHLE